MHDLAKKVFAAMIAVGAAAPAMAADLYEPPVEVTPEPVYGGWYIRGHVGMSNQDYDGLESVLYDDPFILDYEWLDDGGFASAPLFGVGVGYKFNDYLRGDLTAEYRGSADFEALDRVSLADGRLITNDFRARKSEWLVLANAYADLGTFYNVTPYLGAGIGASRNTISQFRDVNIISGGGGYADEKSSWDLAWALHAGLGIQATERLTVDLGYSFVSLGDGKTDTFYNDDPAQNLPNDGFTFKDLYSHDFKLGVRYALN